MTRVTDDATVTVVDATACIVLRSVKNETTDLAANRIENLSKAMVKILAHRPSYNYHHDPTLPLGAGMTTTVDRSDYDDLQKYARDALRGAM